MDKRVFLANARFGRVVLGLFLIFILQFVMVFDVKAVITTRYAKPDGLITGECSSWAEACTLKRALLVAESGEIWVARGVYYPGTNVTSYFSLKNGVAVYGGFAGTETLKEQRDWVANPTVLSGDIDKNDTKDVNGIVTNVSGISGDNVYHVLYVISVDSTAVIDGFIINAGHSDGNGGGVYILEGSPTLRNLVIIANRSLDSGAGLFNSGGSPILTNVAFLGNSITHNVGGGGMFSSNGTLAANPQLTNVLFSGNQASLGSGLYSLSGTPVLINATFSGNNASTIGAVYVADGTITMTNSIVWGNSSSIVKVATGQAVISYSIIEGGFYGDTNKNVNPLFVNPVPFASAPTTAGDYHLQTGSPAIDVGNDFVVAMETDLDGNPRILDGDGDAVSMVDLGAYEWQTYSLFLPLITR